MDDGNGNILGSSSEFLLQEPEDQKAARLAERDDVFKAYPILNGVLQRLRERIAFYSSVASVSPEVQTDPEKFMHTIAANRLTCDNLTNELMYLEELVKTYVAPDIG